MYSCFVAWLIFILVAHGFYDISKSNWIIWYTRSILYFSFFCGLLRIVMLCLKWNWDLVLASWHCSHGIEWYVLCLMYIIFYSLDSLQSFFFVYYLLMFDYFYFSWMSFIYSFKHRSAIYLCMSALLF